MAKRNAVPFSSKVSSSLGLACAIHCISVPFLLAFMPGALSHVISHPLAEGGLLLVSAYFLGVNFIGDYRKHKNGLPLVLALGGFGLLASHQFFGHSHGESWEEFLLPFSGALVLLAAYFVNWRLKRHLSSCTLHGTH